MNLPLAPLAAAIVGLAAAAAVAIVPTWRIEALILDSGLPSLLPAAEPPLGSTARLALMVLAAAIAAVATWAAALRVLVPTRVVRTAPVLRRADAHPDAPAREPVMAARDLGTPFLDVTAKKDDLVATPVPHVEADLPRDLDVPLAAFDPAAIPPVPATPSATVTPLHRKPMLVPEPARIETFDLTPVTRPEPFPFPLRSAPDPEPIAAPETDATIHSLLDRLERGIVRRRSGPAMNERPDAEGLEDALSTLRKFAARG
ncbi:hypothetical protein OKW76_07925 [Sphingomonas sp. S1-29]|uniref:hypothetical protein n=1 Tax=Sphingomonas sp. S1-29 TaxID=2991074 RepID=UPI00223F98D7|nr:hypothetical protein [Sphingomonas sp. S1-29]UZK70935.1 hypothetical protein OKW76_07925 [Sphingomonas sp. S1-29]